MHQKIILASGLPRRKELLELIGIKEYEIIFSDITENINSNLSTPAQVSI